MTSLAFGVLVLSLILGGVFWILFGFLRAVVMHGRVTGEPKCNRCGYSVRGLTQMRCPECSSDLLEVGIRGWAQLPERVIPLWNLALNWLVMCLLFGLVGFGMTFAMYDSQTPGWLWRRPERSGVLIVCLTFGVWWFGCVCARRYIRRRHAAAFAKAVSAGFSHPPSSPGG